MEDGASASGSMLLSSEAEGVEEGSSGRSGWKRAALDLVLGLVGGVGADEVDACASSDCSSTVDAVEGSAVLTCSVASSAFCAARVLLGGILSFYSCFRFAGLQVG